jgi:hypothetical protein
VVSAGSAGYFRLYHPLWLSTDLKMVVKAADSNLQAGKFGGNKNIA